MVASYDRAKDLLLPSEEKRERGASRTGQWPVIEIGGSFGRGIEDRIV